jgi:hypothetical protein
MAKHKAHALHKLTNSSSARWLTGDENKSICTLPMRIKCAFAGADRVFNHASDLSELSSYSSTSARQSCCLEQTLLPRRW